MYTKVQIYFGEGEDTGVRILFNSTREVLILITGVPPVIKSN